MGYTVVSFYLLKLLAPSSPAFLGDGERWVQTSRVLFSAGGGAGGVHAHTTYGSRAEEKWRRRVPSACPPSPPGTEKGAARGTARSLTSSAHRPSPPLSPSPSSPPPPQGESAANNGSEQESGSETNLIRAIQAAQRARGGTKGVPAASSSRSSSAAAGDITRMWRMDGPPPGGSGGGGESTAAAVLALHAVWMALEAASEALLPLWMLSPGESVLCSQCQQSTEESLVGILANPPFFPCPKMYSGFLKLIRKEKK